MSSEAVSDGERAAAALLLFPPPVRVSVLDDDAFRLKFGLTVDSMVRFNQSGVEFPRSVLFSAARQVLAGASSTVDVFSKDGLLWQVGPDSTGVAVRRDGISLPLPQCACLSPDPSTRLGWLETQSRRYRVRDSAIETWRETLEARAAEDEDVERLLDEFLLTPTYVAETIRKALRRGSFLPADLVPSSLRYFARLVGAPTPGVSARQFIATTAATHLQRLLSENICEGLQAGLLLASHGSVAEQLDLSLVSAADVSRGFRWLADHGDRISQVGAIECGLRVITAFPEVAPILAELVTTIADDDPDDPAGRLSLLSSLVRLVEGEIGRTGIARGRPPFWRRLASIAQASLIEREVIATKRGSPDFVTWALASGARVFHVQALIDLRSEPRWQPEFISAAQIKREFVARVAGAAERYRENVPVSLASLLFGTEPTTIQSLREFPWGFLPGPLEGAEEAVAEIPPELERNVRAKLEAEELTHESFVGLVNSSLMFRIGPQLSDMAAEGLRRVGYQLRKANSDDDPQLLLHGLATVSAVTRSKELADGVRILARAVRRRINKGPAPSEIGRIALLAAAAHQDRDAWCRFIGEWFMELAFVEMSQDEACALHADLDAVLHLEPSLWDTCGRAEAAIVAFLASFPVDSEGDNA